jgi:hypothetical protein
MKVDYRIMENVTIGTINNNDLVILNITKQHVEEGDLSFIERHIILLQQCGVSAKHKLMLLFAGYDDIPDEIFEITSIRNLMAKVIEKFPFLFYYLSTFDNHSSIIASCIADVTKVSLGPRLTIKEYEKMGYYTPNLPKVAITIKIPKVLQKKIILGTKKHGQDIGEKQKNIIDLLNNIPGLL